LAAGARLEPTIGPGFANLIAEQLRDSRALDERLVGVAELVRYLALDASWVYAHANELGARRHG
jgi:hypothetical protein